MAVVASPDRRLHRNQAPSVLISGGLAEGGVRTHVRLLCRVLRAAGARVTVVAAATNWPRRSLDELRQTGVRVVVPRWGFGRGAPLGKLEALTTWPLRLRSADVLCCIGYGRMHQFIRLLAGRTARCVYHEIVDAPAPGSPIVRLARRADVIVANSSAVAAGWGALAPQARVAEIPFLVDVPAGRAPPRRFGDELRVVYLGRLVRHKRVDWLVQSWGEIERRIGPARLDVHGGDFPDEPIRAELERTVAEKGLAARVAIHGPYDAERDLDGILGGADLVVLPSAYEGLPLSLVEAVLRGVPIVATGAGGTADLGWDNPDVAISRNDVAGFLSTLEDFCRRIRGGRVERERLRRWAQEHYGFESVASRWNELLLGKTQ